MSNQEQVILKGDGSSITLSKTELIDPYDPRGYSIHLSELIGDRLEPGHRLAVRQFIGIPRLLSSADQLPVELLEMAEQEGCAQQNPEQLLVCILRVIAEKGKIITIPLRPRE